MSMKFTAVITKEENWYVSHCVELGVVSQGKTIEEAQANLKEAMTFQKAKEKLFSIHSRLLSVARLPVFSGRDLVQLLQKNGFRFIRQKGSHVSMMSWPRGRFLAFFKQCGLTKDDLIDLLQKK
jgi:predicted RNase H-like HicB family nuclease